MKTHTKISTLAVVYALCAGVAMPTFAAPSVRALGGAGTYSSASSATQAKTGTASTAQKAETVRGGSLSVDSGTSSAGTKTVTNKVSGTVTGARGSSARSASVRVPSSARLSIGKYLGGASVSTPPQYCKPGDPNCKQPTAGMVDYTITYEPTTKVLEIYDEANGEMIMSRGIASHKELVALQGLVGSGKLDTGSETIIAAINELVAGKQDKLTAGEGININGDEISVNLIGENGITVDGNVIGFEGGDLQSKLNAGDGITIDANNNIAANIGNGLKFENGKIVTDIEFPDAPIQKQIEAGDGIEVELGTDSDTVKVKLAADGGLKFDSDGSLRTAIEFPENPQKEIAAGNGIAVSVGEDKDTVEVKLAEKDSNLTFDSAGGLRVDLPEGGVQEKLTAGTGIKIADNVISTNLRSDSTQLEIRTSETDPNVVVFNLKDVAPADGVITYKAGDGIAIDGDNGISAHIGSGLRFNEDTKAIETIATLPESGEVQAKLTAGKYIYIDENNVITTTLKESDSIQIGEDGTITASVPLKEYKGTDAIEVITSEDGKEATVKLKVNENDDRLQVTPDGLSLNLPEEVQAALTAGAGILIDTDNKISANLIAGNNVEITDVTMADGSEAKEISITLDGNDNTVYAAGDGIKIDAAVEGGESKISINATAEGFYLYNVDASGKGVWQQVQIVDETDVNTSTEATN